MISASNKTESAMTETYGLTAIWQDLEKVEYLSNKGQTKQLVSQAFKSIWLSPVSSLLSLLSIVATLFVLGLCLLIFQNLNTIVSDNAKHLSFSVYLSDRLDSQAQIELVEAIEQFQEVLAVEFWSKERALAEFSKDITSFEGVLEGLKEQNPLPASLELKLKPELQPEYLESLAQRLKDLPGVVHIGYSQELLKQAGKFLEFVKLSAFAIVITLLLITAFVIASTIRLSLLQRKMELKIMRLVGATDRFIQIPCLMEGIVFGLGGAIVSILALWIFYSGLVISTKDLISYIPLLNEIYFLSFINVTLLILIGLVVGLLSSFVASRKIINE
jgi:cell division transport system permease protein